MKNILDELDRQILATLNDQGIKAYGLCQQAYKSDQIHPVTWDKQEQVSIHDRYLCQYYHRILNDVMSDDDEFSFGRQAIMRHEHSVRTVVIVKKKVGSEWIDSFIDAIPTSLVITGFKFVNLSASMNKIVDYEGVYKAEFGNTDTERRMLPYLVYALEWTVDYMTC